MHGYLCTFEIRFTVLFYGFKKDFSSPFFFPNVYLPNYPTVHVHPRNCLLRFCRCAYDGCAYDVLPKCPPAQLSTALLLLRKWRLRNWHPRKCHRFPFLMSTMREENRVKYNPGSPLQSFWRFVNHNLFLCQIGNFYTISQMNWLSKLSK